MSKLPAWFACLCVAIATVVMAAAPGPATAADAVPAPATVPNLEGFWRLQPGYRVNIGRAEPGRHGLGRDWMMFGSYKATEEPPLTPEAMARVKARIDREMSGETHDEQVQQCRTASFYDMISWGDLDILQRGSEVVFIIERDRAMPRRVFLNNNRPDLEDFMPMLGGDARGHVEGDTLVVDARHIDNGPWLLLGDFIRASPDLQVTERYRLEDGGKVLAATWVLTDPKTFSRPWTLNIKWDRLPDDYEPVQETCRVNPRTH